MRSQISSTQILVQATGNTRGGRKREELGILVSPSTLSRQTPFHCVFHAECLELAGLNFLSLPPFLHMSDRITYAFNHMQLFMWSLGNELRSSGVCKSCLASFPAHTVF